MASPKVANTTLAMSGEFSRTLTSFLSSPELKYFPRSNSVSKRGKSEIYEFGETNFICQERSTSFISEDQFNLLI